MQPWQRLGQRDSITTRADLQESLTITRRTDQTAQLLMHNTDLLQELLESMAIPQATHALKLSCQPGQKAHLKRQDILAMLSSLDFHQKQKDVFANRHSGTGQWFLESDQFQRRLNGTQAASLWCRGIRKLPIPLTLSKLAFPGPITDPPNVATAGKTVNLVISHAIAGERGGQGVRRQYSFRP
jgi:hypothetical protein